MAMRSGTRVGPPVSCFSKVFSHSSPLLRIVDQETDIAEDQMGRRPPSPASLEDLHFSQHFNSIVPYLMQILDKICEQKWNVCASLSPYNQSKAYPSYPAPVRRNAFALFSAFAPLECLCAFISSCVSWVCSSYILHLPNPIHPMGPTLTRRDSWWARSAPPSPAPPAATCHPPPPAHRCIDLPPASTEAPGSRFRRHAYCRSTATRHGITNRKRG